MIPEPVADRLDEGRPLATAGTLDGGAGRIEDGHHIVAVDLEAAHPCSYPFLGQGRSARLQLAGHRDGPLVVVDDHHHGEMPDTGAVEPLEEVPLGGAAIADGDHGHPGLVAQLEGGRHPGGVGDLGRDGHTDGQIFRQLAIGLVKDAAPLIPAPILQVLLHGYPTHVEGGHVPIVGHIDILGLHGETDPYPYRLGTEVGGEGAELAGPLQCNRFLVVAAHHHHVAVEGVQYRLVQPGRQCCDRAPLLIEVTKEGDVDMGHNWLLAVVIVTTMR